MRVKNWKKFQHFKDRKPPWIKLYRDILDDIEWHKLPAESAKALVMIWLIASESHDGVLPAIKELAFRMRTNETKIKSIILKLSHWIENDNINAISGRYQSDSLETEGETEKEKEEEREAEACSERTPEASPANGHHELDGSLKKILNDCPHLSLVSNGESSEFWDQVLATCEPYPMANAAWLNAKIRQWNIWFEKNPSRRSRDRKRLESRLFGWLTKDLERLARVKA